MGKSVPSWQTYITCLNGSLLIRHLKKGLAEDLEIPWPSKLHSIECEKVRFRIQDLQPIYQCGGALDTVKLKSCELESGTLQVLENSQSLRCLEIINCGVSDADFDWLKGNQHLEYLNLSENPNCTGAVLKQIFGAPLRMLYLDGTDFQDSDFPMLCSFPQLEYLSISNTVVTDSVLPQLSANRALTIVSNHNQEGLAKFRAAQRQNWKKKLEYDKKTTDEALLIVKDFFAASQNCKHDRSRFVTQQYLDYCKAHGYNRLSRSTVGKPPYQDYQVVDVEQVTCKKIYVYCEQDDVRLSQYRYLVIRTDEGWKIDKSEWLIDRKWRFCPLD